ncbi:serine acetyltransferase [Oryzomonas sagensis]|uniref:Serine acetyltransferase n=1 Tax=Oryzomonas sagensis TaxID=2603857 RepID=A0ABQ6TKA1_9BACT|nr:serine acetyltransferase [Oryzomonas sagensis]KAB0668517.1 serine acetyltransferase [Oryzomonas sagensis]
MNWKQYTFIVTSDLYRYCGQRNLGPFLKCYATIPGFRYSFFMRTARYLKSKGIWFLPIYAMARLLLNHYQFKYGISIPYNTDIGPGLYIGHFGGIIVNCEAKIGCNCNINQEVTIGTTYGGKYPGTPVIMNNVYFGPGSKIIGGITIGNHTAVGANCVVTKPTPDYGVIVGIPGEIVSTKGSGEYVVNTVDGHGH